MKGITATYRTLALTGCLAALALAGCGGGGDDEEPKGAPIPAAQAQELEQRLREVQDRFDFGDGACADIQNDSKPGVQEILASIPSDVRADLRSALRDSFDRLFQLAAAQCDVEKNQPAEPTEPPPETDTTETVPTETETTPTTPTETETTPTTPEQPTTPVEPPSEDDGDNGNGNGNGKGKGPPQTPPGQGGGLQVPEEGEE